MNIGIARGNINKGDIRLFDLVPSVKEEHIEPIKQKPKLPIAKIIMFQKIIRKGIFKRIEKIGIKIDKGIIRKNQKTHKNTKVRTPEIKEYKEREREKL